MSSKYKLSPSSAERFLTCTASLPHNLGFEENKYTLLGQLQHKVAQLRLEQIIENKDNSKKIEKLTDPNSYYVSKNDSDLKVKWNDSCEDTVDNYVTYIKRLMNQFKPKTVLLEYFIKMKFFGNRVNGVVDCAMILEDNSIIIVDLKTGRNKIDAEDNAQMLMYGYGILQDMYQKTKKVADKVVISIAQGLINNVQAVEYSLEQLQEWYRNQAHAMKEINTNQLVYRPSKSACKYCQYRHECAARIKKGITI